MAVEDHGWETATAFSHLFRTCAFAPDFGMRRSSSDSACKGSWPAVCIVAAFLLALQLRQEQTGILPGQIDTALNTMKRREPFFADTNDEWTNDGTPPIR